MNVSKLGFKIKVLITVTPLLLCFLWMALVGFDGFDGSSLWIGTSIGVSLSTLLDIICKHIERGEL